MNASLHSSLKDDIINKIRSGELLPGDKLPSESMLMKTYALSQTTVSKCLQTLSNEGYIVNIPRVGNYIKKSKSTQYELIYDEESIVSLLSDEVEYRDFNCAFKAPNGVMELTFRKIYFSEKKVIGFSDGTLNLRTDTPISEETVRGPLTEFLREHYNLHGIKKSLVIRATACLRDAAEVLGISEGAVILCVERSFHTVDGELVALSRSCYRDGLFDLYLHSQKRSLHHL